MLIYPLPNFFYHLLSLFLTLSLRPLSLLVFLLSIFSPLLFQLFAAVTKSIVHKSIFNTLTDSLEK